MTITFFSVGGGGDILMGRLERGNKQYFNFGPFYKEKVTAIGYHQGKLQDDFKSPWRGYECDFRDDKATLSPKSPDSMKYLSHRKQSN